MKVLNRVEIIVEKEEISHFYQFLLLPPCFQIPSAADAENIQLHVEKGLRLHTKRKSVFKKLNPANYKAQSVSQPCIPVFAV